MKVNSSKLFKIKTLKKIKLIDYISKVELFFSLKVYIAVNIKYMSHKWRVLLAEAKWLAKKYLPPNIERRAKL